MSLQLTNEQISSLLRGISIPPQPQIMVDLQLEQLSPSSDIDNIARLIAQDIGLSGAILKTVNSRLFGLPEKITSVRQAVHLLGTDSVVNLVNAHSIKGELSDEAITALSRFWDSAMDIAMVSAAVARHINYPQPDESYSLGLFHNCGVVLLMGRYDNYLQVMEQSYAEQQQRIIDIENEHFNTNHAVVGYYVARSWNLPTYLCEAIAEHHSVDRIFTDEQETDQRKKMLLATLKVAEHICATYRVLGDQKTDFEWERIEQELLNFVGLSQYDYINLLESFAEMGLGNTNYILNESP